jgi:hypothetical protein
MYNISAPPYIDIYFIPIVKAIRFSWFADAALSTTHH